MKTSLTSKGEVELYKQEEFFIEQTWTSLMKEEEFLRRKSYLRKNYIKQIVLLERVATTAYQKEENSWKGRVVQVHFEKEGLY